MKIISPNIHEACKHGDFEAVKSCIKAGVDLNLPDIHDEMLRSPLHIAIQKSNYDIVKILVAAQAKINIVDSTNSSPLFTACEIGNLKIVEKLLLCGADINIYSRRFHCIDSEFFTPFHIAVEKGFSKIVQFLIQSGVVDINKYSRKIVNGNCEDFESPLVIAIKADQLDIIKILLAAGARMYLSALESPVHMAINRMTPVKHSLDFFMSNNYANVSADTSDLVLHLSNVLNIQIQIVDTLNRETNWRRCRPLLLMKSHPYQDRNLKFRPTKLATLLTDSSIECHELRRRICKYL